MTNRDAINLLEEVKILDDTMYAYNPNYLEALDMALTALEAEETWYAIHEYPQKQRWIPCSERLPDSPIRVLIQIDNGWIVTAYYEDGWWWSVPDWDVDTNADNMYALPINWKRDQYQILAWMPLPEPYKEKEGEKTKHYETN